MKVTEFFSMLQEIPRNQILCFTGHRPEKLPTGKQYDALIQTLYYYIDLALDQNYTVFLNGMADGIDYLAAEYLFRKRNDYPNIQVIGIQPFANYEEFFRQRHYHLQHLWHMRESFNEIICLEGKYNGFAGKHNDILFRNRNYFLVDHSSALIAVCSRERSGSMQTFEYAKRQKLAVYRIEANPHLLYTPKPEQWPVEKINF